MLLIIKDLGNKLSRHLVSMLRDYANDRFLQVEISNENIRQSYLYSSLHLQQKLQNKFNADICRRFHSLRQFYYNMTFNAQTKTTILMDDTKENYNQPTEK